MGRSILTASWRATGVLVGIVVLVAGCGLLEPAPPTATPAAPSSPATPVPSPTPEAISTLIVGIGDDLAGGLSNAATGHDAVRLASFVHASLFRLDGRLRPVPELADGPATATDDGLTWMVPLRTDLTFHDGSPLAVDDVLLSYRLAMSRRCAFDRSACLSGVVTAVEASGPSAVQFTLARPVVGFDALHLGLWIEPAARIEAAFEAWTDGAAQVAVDDLVAFEEAVAVAADLEDPALRAEGERILTVAGVAAPSVDAYTRDGVLDIAGYMGDLLARVRAIDATFTDTPGDAMAAAYPYLDLGRAPVGAGPWMLSDEAAADEDAVEFVPFVDHAGGEPVIDRLTARSFADPAVAARAVAAGEVDWLPDLPAAFVDAASGPGIRTVEYPESGFLALSFNLNPVADGLFVDPRVRQAVAACFGNEAIVDAATGGRGQPIVTEIPTMSWAYPPDATPYRVDRTSATALLEDAGWVLGGDGVYARDGRRLSTTVPVREGFPERTAWLTRVAEEVLACGIELIPTEVPFDAFLDMLDVYPHANAADPDAGIPFDAYLGGFLTSIDPDPFAFYHSSECSSAERPLTFNTICYQNPQVDALIEAARAETDRTARAATYATYAALLAEDVPVIYAWTDVLFEAVGPGVGTTDPAGLRLDSPTWSYPLERLTSLRRTAD